MSKMKITVLGNSGAYPTKDNPCSGYLVETDKAKILLDCGSGILPKLTSKINLAELNAIIISHLHYDHMSDLMVLGYALMLNEIPPIKLYIPDSPEAESYILRTFEYFNVSIIDTGRMLEIEDVKVSFRQVKHSILSYATKIECDNNQLVYTGDTCYTDEIPSFAKFCDLLICDAAFSAGDAPVNRPHATAKEAGMMAREAEVAKLLVTHFAPGVDVEQRLHEAKDEFKYTAAAEPELVINI